jgi:hypothetical protein
MGRRVIALPGEMSMVDGKIENGNCVSGRGFIVRKGLYEFN